MLCEVVKWWRNGDEDEIEIEDGDLREKDMRK